MDVIVDIVERGDDTPGAAFEIERLALALDAQRQSV
jgi:hypothetical protein